MLSNNSTIPYTQTVHINQKGLALPGSSKYSNFMWDFISFEQAGTFNYTYQPIVYEIKCHTKLEPD
jgi:hypothetical protein